jgi:plastocyanin
MKRLITTCLLFVLVAFLVVACGGSSGGSGSGGTVTVHTSGPNFAQASVSLSKGDSLTIVDDDSMTHTIANGSWSNGVPQPITEPGAPTVNVNLDANNSQATVGPFNTAGTFHLYCSIHPDMNLTVTVS